MAQITFQQGVNGYTGTLDTMLRQATANQKYGSSTNLSIDANEDGGRNQGLLRFEDLFGSDAGQIPEGAIITKATLTLETSSRGDGAQLHRMLSSWTETDTYATLGNGVQANDREAAAEADLVTGGVFSFGPSTLDVTRSVQAWANGEENFGWAFLPSGSNGWDFISSEGAVAPKLTVEYTIASDIPGGTSPVANDDSISTRQGTPVRINVLANDSDPNSDPLTVSIATNAASHGTAVINTDNSVTYTPAAGYLGDDSFIYTVSDGQGGTDTATVRVAVTTAATSPFSGSASPTVETQALPGTFDSGDVADDPAIWIDQANPARSVVIGTDKDAAQGGLYVFDLQGNIVSSTSHGQSLNNVDLRYGFKLGGSSVDLVGASNRSTGSIDFFALDPETHTLTPAGSVPTGLSDIYGFTMSRTDDGKFYAYVSTTGSWEDSSEATTILQLELDGSSGKVMGTAVRSFSPGTQVEGMVVDDQTGTLYVAEEDVGIWKYGADPTAGTTRTQVDRVGGGNLTADVEGLAIYYGPDGTGYLIASSQGSSTYAVYDRAGSNPHLGSFRIASGNNIDGASDTDGLEVTNMGLGSAFPTGMLVVHDNSNSGASTSNFKFVPWESVATLGGLVTDTTYNPLDGLLQ